MIMSGLLETLYNLPVSVAVRENEVLFPWLETFHVLAVATVFGSIFMVDLRLIGVAAHRRGAARLIADLLPFTWVGFALAVVTGTLMFVSQAPDYAANPWFRIKFVFLALAGLNMMIFHRTVYRRIGEWDLSMPPPQAARNAGALSILLWVCIVVFGRWIAFAA